MDKNIKDLHFEDTYYLANIVEATVFSTFDYLRFFDEIWGEDRILGYHIGFGKNSSSLQFFIKEICYMVYLELTRDIEVEEYKRKKSSYGGATLKIDSLIKKYTKHTCSYDSWLKDNPEDTPFDYFYAIANELDEVFEEMSYEVFHILFQNRAFLQEYNQLVADYSKSYLADNELDPTDKQFYSSKGYLKRTAIPKWVQRSIFFRDRGRCVYCIKDLSGLVSLLSKENFDHIIPLAEYGANDISNIQLCCKECNNKKLKKILEPSTKYEKWF